MSDFRISEGTFSDTKTYNLLVCKNYDMVRISQVNVSDITFRISFRIFEKLFGSDAAPTSLITIIPQFWRIFVLVLHALTTIEDIAEFRAQEYC